VILKGHGTPLKEKEGKVFEVFAGNDFCGTLEFRG
tara:strand:- start:1909 stop:2013 length:105 start_codon:yes stop_codon:yes gene_type:complete